MSTDQCNTSSYATMNSLKSITKTSTFINSFKAEPLVPTIQSAIKLLNSNDEDSGQLRTKLFNTPRQIQSGSYQFTIPTKRKDYKLLETSKNALKDLSLDLSQPKDEYFKKIVTGEEFFYNDEVFPYSQVYSGFQFGSFAGQLGDGRVVNLFEIVNDNTGQKFELQLKGAGKTAFSRFADGKAVTRSSIREFIISEYLNSIGVPTARALSLTYLKGTWAQREKAETCAVITRFAQSWIRIGTFDYYNWKQDKDTIKKLSKYVINEVLIKLPEIKRKYFNTELEEDEKYKQMIKSVCYLNSQSVAYWQAYGFMNGVLNTDNTSIIGLSIDFGPFSFLDKFDPNFTPNHDDHQLRYSFQNQPSIIWWNLTKFINSMSHILNIGDDFAKELFNEYESNFLSKYIELMGKRLGLYEIRSQDNDLISELLEILMETKVQFNHFFINLQNSKLDQINIFLTHDLVERMQYPQDKIDKELNMSLSRKINKWLENYRQRLTGISYEERLKVASNHNPKFIPNNWILDQVIDSVQDSKAEDLSYLHKITKMSMNPFDESEWGNELMEDQKAWCFAEHRDEEKFMRQCSCSS